MEWTSSTTLLYPALAVGAGIAAGLLGIGGMQKLFFSHIDFLGKLGNEISPQLTFSEMFVCDF